jgi:hypothetical protein
MARSRKYVHAPLITKAMTMARSGQAPDPLRGMDVIFDRE